MNNMTIALKVIAHRIKWNITSELKVINPTYHGKVLLSYTITNTWDFKGSQC